MRACVRAYVFGVLYVCVFKRLQIALERRLCIVASLFARKNNYFLGFFQPSFIFRSSLHTSKSFIMKKVNSLAKVLADLTTQHGAQRLSPALRRIEIEKIPTTGAHASHRLFVKKVLPRIKFNNQDLEIDVRWIEGVAGKNKKSSRQSSETSEAIQTSEESTETAASTQETKMPVRARLLFDGLPTREINLRTDANVNEITNEIFQAVRETTEVSEPFQPSTSSEAVQPAI